MPNVEQTPNTFAPNPNQVEQISAEQKQQQQQQDDLDVSTSEQLSEETSNDEKPRRSKRGSFKHQLIVENVYPDGTVECQLRCKQKTISFKFNRLDTTPSDIIEGMIKQGLLKEGPYKQLSDHLKEVIDQLKVNPSQIPDCGATPYVQKVRVANILRIYVIFALLNESLPKLYFLLKIFI